MRLARVSEAEVDIWSGLNCIDLYNSQLHIELLKVYYLLHEGKLFLVVMIKP